MAIRSAAASAATAVKPAKNVGARREDLANAPSSTIIIQVMDTPANMLRTKVAFVKITLPPTGGMITWIEFAAQGVRKLAKPAKKPAETAAAKGRRNPTRAEKERTKRRTRCFA